MTSAAVPGAVAGAMVALCWVALEAGRRHRRATRVLRRFVPGSPRRGFPIVDLVVHDGAAPTPSRAAVARINDFLGASVHRRRAEKQLIEWIDSATQIVRSGGSLRQALVAGVEGLAEPGRAFQRLHDDLTAGATLDDALARFASDDASQSARLAARSISLAGETGGRPARLLEGIGFTVRERLECSREARALATQARSSAVVIMAAPIGFAVLAVGVDPRVGAFLFGTVGGLTCVVGGVTLELAGCAWMARLVRSAA